MEFLDADFKKMHYPVHSVRDSEDILKKIPELRQIDALKAIPEIYEGIVRTQVVKYIAYMYDRDSPIHSIPDVMQRRYMAGVLARFPKESSVKFTKPAEDILSGENKIVNKAITEFVVSFNSALYTRLVVYLSALEDQLENILTGSYKSDAIVAVDELEASISKIIRTLANEDSAKFVINDIYEKARSESLRLRPEDIAEKIENNEELVSVTPYGESYNFPDNEWTGVKLLADIPSKRK